MAPVQEAAPLSDLETSFALLRLAARGDIAAQRALAMQSVSLVESRTDLDPATLLTDGLIFARMAAVQGDVSDEGRVIAMLAQLGRHFSDEGDEYSSATLMAETIARVALLSERGSDLAEAKIQELIDQASPEVVVMAKEFERAMRG